MTRSTSLLAICVALALAASVAAQAPCRTQACFQQKLPLLHDKLNEIFNMPPPSTPPPAPAQAEELASDARRKGDDTRAGAPKPPPPPADKPVPPKPPGGSAPQPPPPAGKPAPPKPPGGSAPQPAPLPGPQPAPKPPGGGGGGGGPQPAKPPGGGGGGGGPQVVAKLVRLAFHSCFMGCHGVVDATDPANRGITESDMPIIQNLYDAEFAPFMSKADYWAAAGNFALIKGAVNANLDLTAPSPPLAVTFFHGRLDDASLLNRSRSIPHPHMPDGLNQLTTFFVNSFGMNQGEAVAIMGAHTLGRARPDVSGFRGRWVNREDALDNAYFSDMIRRGWTQVRVDGGACPETGCWQWVRSDVGGNGIMMMNADMALAEKVQANEEGRSQCVTTGACADESAGRSFVETFAHDNDAWLRVFSTAWNKMVSAQGGGNVVTATTYKSPEYVSAGRRGNGCATLSVPYFGICF